MKGRSILIVLLAFTMLVGACGGTATQAPAPTTAPAAVAPTTAPAEPAPTTAPADQPTTAAAADASGVQFFSTQFNVVEEQETFRAILTDGGFDFTGMEEGPLLDLVTAGAQAGSGTIDLIGALHGTFPPLQRDDALVNLADLVEDLSGSRDFAPAFLSTGLLGTEDYLYYVPWMQATYIMAAHNDALEYLPDGADINALTWEQFGEWCKAINDGEGKPLCGMPHAGLFHRFLQGYAWLRSRAGW